MPYRKRIGDVSVIQESNGQWTIQSEDGELQLTDEEYAILHGLMSGGMAWTEQMGGWGIDHYTMGIPEFSPWGDDPASAEELERSIGALRKQIQRITR